MKKLLHCLIFLLPSGLFAQLYFPPQIGNQWDTVSIQSLGWCPDRVDSLLNFLEEKNSNSFIILHKGKIAIEKYFGTYEQDSFWYWASAGKSLTAFLTGCLQADGQLDIDDATSQYLGQGWTNCTPAQEAQITIRNQLKMTTGLDDMVPDVHCLVDTCLNYLTDPDTRWAYYNAPYRLILDVLVSASSSNDITLLTFSRIGTRIGMGGAWINYVRWSKARDMARFGLLNLSRGVWNGDTILNDPTYFQEMTTSSQNLNPSYGYLWWLNGQGSYMLPTVQFLFQGDLVPNAPSDMYAAMGKNDQRIFVVPSQDLVVVRQGKAADTVSLAVSAFDNDLWQKISDLSCTTSAEESKPASPLKVFPNPADERLMAVSYTHLTLPTIYSV